MKKDFELFRFQQEPPRHESAFFPECSDEIQVACLQLIQLAELDFKKAAEFADEIGACVSRARHTQPAPGEEQA